MSGPFVPTHAWNFASSWVTPLNAAVSSAAQMHNMCALLGEMADQLFEQESMCQFMFLYRKGCDDRLSLCILETQGPEQGNTQKLLKVYEPKRVEETAWSFWG